jgi:putative DNA methylase
MTASVPPKKLIEVSIPFEAINAEARRRKQKAPKGYPTSIHKYWAQRPIAACRAVLFAQLVDDPSSWPGQFPSEEEQETERKRLHKLIERLLPWEASNDEAILNEARWEIARSVARGLGEEPPPKADGKAILDYLQTKAPPVYDPFSGGGSIPLEAQRLGLRAYGSDLNPIAVLIGKALVEIPPKFAGRPPVNPNAQGQLKRGHWNGRGAQGLAEDVRYYGQWMRDEAEKRIGNLYPKAKLRDGSESIVTAWIWARTIRSPDPAAKGAMVPLVTSFLLSTKEGRKVWIEPVVDSSAQDGYRFVVKTGVLTKKDEARLKSGTKSGRGANFTCLLTGASIDGDYVKAEGSGGRFGCRLLALVAESGRGRVYLDPAEEHEIAALACEPTWEPHGTLPDDPRSFWTVQYGLNTFASLFTKRQLTSLSFFSDLVAEAQALALDHARHAGLSDDTTSIAEGGNGAIAYSQAIATYLGFAIDRMATYGSSLCKWLTKDNALAPSIPQQGIAMSYDFAEGNPLAKSSAEINQCVSVVAACIENVTPVSQAYVFAADARKASVDQKAIIATDPPYYDNIPYADCSDFFYVWLSHTLRSIWPDLFRRLQTPKEEELVATPYRHGGAEVAYNFFMTGMGYALRNIESQSNKSFPMTIYYAFKQTDESSEGKTSKGWSSFLQAVIDCGIAIDGTWPLRTELTSALKNELNSLASSIVLVCRSRQQTAVTTTRGELIRALKREMPDAIHDIRKAGVGPVDMQQSVIGPGMGIFTRYAKVLEDDDSAMAVKTALSLINRVWEEIENELDAIFDAETQVALAWFATYGFDARASGELITLANAKNIPSSALFGCGVFKDLKGKTALTPRNDWWPAEISPTDSDDEKKRKRELTEHGTATVWACVQKAAAILNAESGGGEAAGQFAAQMGSKAEAARALAYRLFEIATKKGWAAEALVYNELAQEWPKLEELASSAGARTERAAAQGTLQL